MPGTVSLAHGGAKRRRQVPNQTVWSDIGGDADVSAGHRAKRMDGCRDQVDKGKHNILGGGWAFVSVRKGGATVAQTGSDTVGWAVEQSDSGTVGQSLNDSVTATAVG